MAPVPTSTKQPSNTSPGRASPGGRVYDLIVVGAGGMGSAAAYHAARAGRRVLLVEQFQIGHTRGSSHGGSRIIRYTHDTTDYAAQMPATFQLWAELERASGARLLQLTGGLYLGAADDPWLAACQSALSALDFPYQHMEPAELRQAYPQFRLPDGWHGLYQANTGILAASRCVETMVAQAVKHGAELREQTQVSAVRPDGDGVAVALTSGETLLAHRAVIAAGPWAQRLLRDLLPFAVPLRVTHQQVAYFPARDPAAFAVGVFPIFIASLLPHFYGFPIWERPGALKLAVEQTTRVVDPDAERTIDEALLADLAALVVAHLPDVDPTPVHVEPCLYTETPTRDFIIDRHPQYPQIVIAAGFSGRGFKHTIAIGQLLNDLAYSEPGVYASPFWLERYRLTRFVEASAL
ncbi:MAG TPA: N-methyl-L-tryptophan oxidase [Caldilineaceae bacterium]|nr:N-methyl-L-tryptophan oxidase [Caldilineaceae bacterium]